MMPTRLTRLVTGSALLLAAVLAGCSSGDEAACGGIIAPKRTITLVPTILSIDPGVDTLVNATVTGGCSTEDRSVRWSVADPAIATVDGTGRLRAVGSGTTTLTATAFTDRVTAQLPVTVKPRMATTLAITPRLDTLSPLGTRTLSATVRDQTGSILPSAAVSYRSLTPNLATVSSTGVISAVAAGTASIEAATQKVGADSLHDTVRVLIVTACSLIRPLQPGATISGVIDVSGCQNFLGYRVANQYSITSANQIYFSVRLAPAGSMALVPLIVSGSTFGLPVADTAVTAYVVARAGTTTLLATAPSTATVPFTLTTALDPDPKTLCVPTDATLNVAFRTALTPTCLARDIRVLPPLAVGQTLRITGLSAGFPVTLELRNNTNNTLLQRSVATAAGAQASIVYTNGLAAQLVRLRVLGPAAANDYVTVTIAP